MFMGQSMIVELSLKRGEPILGSLPDGCRPHVSEV
jgi:hypothetical protein